MGTVINEKVWSGVCVNGEVVSGLAKNGNVFYRKPVSIYKRRIMVEDNLSARTIFQDFPDNFYKNDISYGSTRNIVISNDVNVYEYMNEGGFYEIMCGNSYIYRYDLISGTVFSKQDVNVGSYPNANVTAITENEAYRHLFIEDSNIRPLEVGDVITENTKFYFTFPDNFNSSINFEDRKYIVVMDNTYTGFIVNKDYLGSSVVAATISFGFGSTQVEIYEYDNDNDTLLQNDSYRTNIKNGDDNFVGTVTNIDTTDNIYQYILVDTTTLGA